MSADGQSFENDRVLDVVQALVGTIDTELLAVAISADASTRSVDIYVASSGPLTEPEFAEELADEVEALGGGDLTVRAHHWTGTDWTRDWPGSGHRIVFGRRVG